MNCKEIKGILGKELHRNMERGFFRGEIKFNEPMSLHTSLKIGGPADVMVFPEDPLSLKNVVVAARREKVPVFVFGSGTNLLVRDGGIEGIAVSLRALKNIKCINDPGRAVPGVSPASDIESPVITLFVEAGVSLNELVSFTRENGYAGIEALAGIPGTFGGAVYMNAGSFGTEIKDVIVSVALMDIEGRIEILEKDKLKFSYRNSNLPEDTIILSSNIVLDKNSPETVSERTKGFLKKKRLAQPLGQPSAGCVFKNPEGDSAGRLIDAAGCKGMGAGDVEISAVHANFFINKSGASCRDFIGLMETVRARVKESSGITLEPEIKIIGRDK